jgi:hypothetical protein
MKKLKLAALLFFSSLTFMSVRADVIYQELFNYTNGLSDVVSTNVVDGILVTNWLVHSESSDDSFINNHRLEVDTSPARTADIHRFFSITNGSIYTNAQQVLYASFIVNFTNLPTAAGAYFAHFYFSSSIFPCRIWAQTNGTVLPNTFRLGIDPGATAPPNKIYPVDLALNTDYQVVVGYCPVTGDPGGLADDSVTLWINPVSFSDASVTTSDAFVPGTNIVNAFAFRQASGFGGFLTVSNLVVSTTYNEATTNVLSTNAVAPTIIVQPFGVTNFPTASISIAALAAGQGLGSLTYQWQESATPDNASPSNVSNPNGNSNVFSIPNAQTTDSGYYSLVVTTPYGLSVTSAVAKVSIVDGPFPPVFTQQPASQTIFSGQSATMSTTVIEPPSGGTAVYTWYSNNVVVTAGQSDNGLSSSYAFNNATTNFSATYKVAVTNAFGGIVSSNAVLSVLKIPVVSVAFLRTLVNPNNNYQATNSTLPFQVTGTITTATNITAGNTASYYLQDATAGINIFATFGSTFRPAQGAVVTFVGVMSSFSSGLELDADPTDLPYTSFTDTGTTAPLPAPMVIPFTITNSGFANMNTNIAGRYVQLQNVFFGTNAGTTISSGFMTVTNSLGQQFNLWFSAQDLDTVGQTVPVFASSVTGVMFGSMNPNSSGVASPNFAVAVTRFADIVVIVSPIPLTMNVSGGTLTFNWTDPSFSLQCATNVVGPWTTITGASSGFMTNATPDQPEMFFRLSHP